MIIQDEMAFILIDEFIELLEHFQIDDDFVGSEHKFKLLFNPVSIHRSPPWFIVAFESEADVMQFVLSVSDFPTENKC